MLRNVNDRFKAFFNAIDAKLMLWYIPLNNKAIAVIAVKYNTTRPKKNSDRLFTSNL